MDEQTHGPSLRTLAQHPQSHRKKKRVAATAIAAHWHTFLGFGSDAAQHLPECNYTDELISDSSKHELMTFKNSHRFSCRPPFAQFI